MKEVETKNTIVVNKETAKNLQKLNNKALKLEKKELKYSQKQELKAKLKQLEKQLIEDDISRREREAERRKILLTNFKINAKINLENKKAKIKEFFIGK